MQVAAAAHLNYCCRQINKLQYTKKAADLGPKHSSMELAKGLKQCRDFSEPQAEYGTNAEVKSHGAGSTEQCGGWMLPRWKRLLVKSRQTVRSSG
jgi:hypothetical protein